MNPEFSIITVCFNSEKTIERTIISVLSQSYQDFEYIIVDGASTDGTLSIIKNYIKKYPDKIKLISEKDNGIYDAMNKGIRSASGNLIGIVNSDDYYEIDALENISRAYDGKKYEIVYGMLRTIKDGKEVSVYIKNHQWLNDDMITHPTCFVTKDTYVDFGLYSLEYRYSADYEFMIRMNRNKQVVFNPIYKIISNFSLDGASGSIKGYMDTLKLKYRYNLISKKKYYFEIIKSKIALMKK
mgnify:CR=1 FL=1